MLKLNAQPIHTTSAQPAQSSYIRWTFTPNLHIYRHTCHTDGTQLHPNSSLNSNLLSDHIRRKRSISDDSLRCCLSDLFIFAIREVHFSLQSHRERGSFRQGTRLVRSETRHTRQTTSDYAVRRDILKQSNWNRLHARFNSQQVAKDIAFTPYQRTWKVRCNRKLSYVRPSVRMHRNSPRQF